MNTKKRHNLINIIDWISASILVVFDLVTTIMYMTLKNPTIQRSIVFIAEILITIIFILLILLDSIQCELDDIKNSLDDSYDLKQINGVRSIVNKRHIEELLNGIEKTINDTYNGGKINEENKN